MEPDEIPDVRTERRPDEPTALVRYVVKAELALLPIPAAPRPAGPAAGRA